MLSDVRWTHLNTTVASRLGVRHLSLAPEMSNKERRALLTDGIDGILYEANARPIVPLHVQIGSSCRSVFFIVDTGSPWTFICPNAINGFDAEVPSDYFKSTIQGVVLPITHVSSSSSHFSDLNILGTDYMRTAGVELRADYTNLTLTLTRTRGSPETEATAHHTPV